MFFELRRACEVERGMAPDGVVEAVDVSADGRLRLGAVSKAVRQTSSDFSVLKNVSTMALS